MNAGSYLVTLLISCGPALPCGCCSRDDGDEEKGEGGRGAGAAPAKTTAQSHRLERPVMTG